MRGTQPSAAAQDPAPSPAEAFFDAFREAACGVRFTALREDADELARAAGAFRTAELRAAAWVRQRLGWEMDAARELGQDFALVAGDWLMAGTGDLDALRHQLQRAWRDGREPGGG